MRKLTVLAGVALTLLLFWAGWQLYHVVVSQTAAPPPDPLAEDGMRPARLPLRRKGGEPRRVSRLRRCRRRACLARLQPLLDALQQDEERRHEQHGEASRGD